MIDKVALVTGANTGIGFSIVKELCRRGVKVVYLASRNVTKGQKAVEQLNKEGFSPMLIQLEVTNITSIQAAAEIIKETHGGLDILINNAGVITADFNKISYEDAKRVIDVNYRSFFLIEEYLYPILNKDARVVNVASDCGLISNLNNKYWIERITKPDLKVEDIDAFVDWFLDSVKNGSLNENDFKEMPILAYRISKIALVALTTIQAKKIGNGISINALHPGLVKTNMTKGSGFFTIEDASKAPVYLALDITQSVTGEYFWYDKTIKNWRDPNLNLCFKAETLQKYA